MQRKALAHSLGLSPSTLSKWLVIYEQVTDRSVPLDIPLDVAGHLQQTVDVLAVLPSGTTFREALLEVLDLAPGLSPQEATTVMTQMRQLSTEVVQLRTEVANLHTVMTAGTTEVRESLTTLADKLEQLVDRASPITEDDIKTLRCGVEWAVHAGQQLDRGFLPVETTQGVVLIPRTAEHGELVKVTSDDQDENPPGVVARILNLFKRVA